MEVVARLKRMCFNESKILKQLDHPNIMGIIDFYEDSSSKFVIATEICEGVDLFELIK
jgi:serine/threonine protein kinase